jgi:Spy/CpxP family protein refolding chaperone
MKFHLGLILNGLMILVLTTGTTLLIITNPGFAKPLQTVAQMPPNPADLPELNLTADQQQQIQQIHTATRARMSEILNPEQMNQFQAGIAEGQKPPQLLSELNLSRDQKTQLREVMMDQKQKMSEILTPEQEEQVKKMQESRSATSGRPGT